GASASFAARRDALADRRKLGEWRLGGTRNEGSSDEQGKSCPGADGIRGRRLVVWGWNAGSGGLGSPGYANRDRAAGSRYRRSVRLDVFRRPPSEPGDDRGGTGVLGPVAVRVPRRQWLEAR